MSKHQNFYHIRWTRNRKRTVISPALSPDGEESWHKDAFKENE